MIFNCTKNFQFSTRLYLENNLLEIISETKLLGTIITSDLKWHKNTEMITRKGFQRMIILRKLYSFKVEQSDLLNIYILYIRSILEQSCQVWHYDITQEEVLDLERVQKCAFRIILQDDYLSYEHALQALEMDTLKARRDILCLKSLRDVSNTQKLKECSLLTLLPIFIPENVKPFMYSMLKHQDYVIVQYPSFKGPSMLNFSRSVSLIGTMWYTLTTRKQMYI